MGAVSVGLTSLSRWNTVSQRVYLTLRKTLKVNLKKKFSMGTQNKKRRQISFEVSDERKQREPITKQTCTMRNATGHPPNFLLKENEPNGYLIHLLLHPQICPSMILARSRGE